MDLYGFKCNLHYVYYIKLLFHPILKIHYTIEGFIIKKIKSFQCSYGSLIRISRVSMLLVYTLD